MSTISGTLASADLSAGDFYYSAFNPTLTTSTSYYQPVEETELDAGELLKRFMRFRDLKIVSIKDLGFGNIEITAIKKRRYYKIKIKGSLLLEDVKGEELEKIGKETQPPIYGTFSPTTLGTTTTTEDVWTTMDLNSFGGETI